MASIAGKAVLLALRTSMVRELLAWYLQFEYQCRIVGSSGDGHESIELCRIKQPDVLILEYSSALHCEEVIAELRKSPRPVPVLVVAKAAYSSYELYLAGAMGCVTFNDDPSVLASALAAILDGGRLFTHPLGSEESTLPRFTARQLVVLEMVVAGLSTKQIADRLKISFKTADHHRSRMMRKAKVHSSIDLVRYALERGLVQMNPHGGVHAK